MRTLLLTSALVLLASPVLAGENPVISAMHYKSMQERPDSNNSYIRTKTINSKTAAEEETDGTASSRVWKKYKALAAGQYEESEEKITKSAKPQEEESVNEQKPAQAAEAAPPAQPTGFAAIIDEYRKNKEQRSQMRTISVTKPQTPAEPAKPEPPAKPAG